MKDRIKEEENKSQFIIDCIKTRCEREAMQEQIEALNGIGEVYTIGEQEMELPFYVGSVACGLPTESAGNSVTDVLDMIGLICPHRDTSLVVRAKGDSMIDANIHSGDLIVVDTSVRTPIDRTPLLCELNGKYTVKFVRHLKSGYWLIPANETFAETEVTENDTFNIWGAVTSVVHLF